MDTFLLAVILLSHTTCQAMSSDIEPKCSKFDFEEKMLEKMVKLEHKTGLMVDHINEHSAQVKAELAIMKTDIEQQGTEQRNSFVEVSQQIQKDFANMKIEFDYTKQALHEQWDTANETMQRKMETFRKEFADFKEVARQPSYAFSAYDLSAARPSEGTILVFAKTLMDDHGVYNNSTGKFTAPVSGLYMFSATIHATSNNYGCVEIMAGEKSVSKFQAGDKEYYSSSSGFATVQLQKAMQVYLRVTSAGSGFALIENVHHMNGFTGLLITINP